jgi:hypothetical protein
MERLGLVAGDGRTAIRFHGAPEAVERLDEPVAVGSFRHQGHVGRERSDPRR